MKSLKHTHYIIFCIIIGLSVFAFILYRSVFLSLAIDEAATGLISDFSYSDIMFSPSCFNTANNHVLNSLLMKYCMGLWSSAEWAMRLPNNIAFVFYFIAVLLFVKETCKTIPEKIMAVTLFCAIRYLLDFFSLCRGYGIANAFEMCSVTSYVYYITTKRNHFVFLSFLFAAISVYANFTMLNVLLALGVVHLLHQFFFEQYSLKKIVYYNIPLLLIAVPLYLLIRLPMHFIKKNDELRWGANGWFDALFTFSKRITSSTGIIALAMEVLLLLLGLVCIIIIAKQIRNKTLGRQDVQSKIFLFITALLLTIILGTVFQRNALNIMYLESRKSTLYIPLLCSLIITLHQYLVRQNNIHYLLPFSTLLFVVLFFVANRNIYFEEWPFNEYSKEVGQKIHQLREPNKVNIACGRYLNWTLIFYGKYHFANQFENVHTPDEWNTEINYDFYYVYGEDTIQNPEHYSKVESYPNNTFLYARSNN